MLLKFGADISIKSNDGSMPLHTASRYSRIKINVPGSSGFTPLHLAARSGNIKTVRALVTELGADVNATDENRRTPPRGVSSRVRDGKGTPPLFAPPSAHV